jgi:hypothetical protein
VKNLIQVVSLEQVILVGADTRPKAPSAAQLDKQTDTPKLTPARLPTGSDRSWVSRSKDGLLVLKP